MNWIKTHWKEIIIVFLLIFSLNKCTQSCSRGNAINQISIEKVQIENTKDSIIGILNDSISLMNIKLQVYEEKISGLNQALYIQDEANKRISEAKKNISISLKK